jgi:hypothetical protein
VEHIRARSGASVYFFDYDSHVFELDATAWEEALGIER